MRKLIPVALLTLLGATHHNDALAATFHMVATGTFGSTFEENPEQLPIAPTQVTANFSQLLGQQFSIDVLIDSAGSSYQRFQDIPEIPSAFTDERNNSLIQYQTSINGVSISNLSGSGRNWSWISIIDDVTVPDTVPPNYPPAIQGGHTYDMFDFGIQEVGFACKPGLGQTVCGHSPLDVYEGYTPHINFVWDTAQHDALHSGDPLQLLLNGGPDFSHGQGIFSFDLWYYSPLDDHPTEIAWIRGNIDSISLTTVSAVPLPQSWALLLPALGMIGVLKRRKG